MSTDDRFAAIEALELAPIKMKLMHVESGEGWSRSKVDAVEADYRRFLYLMKKYPNEQTSPNVDVDVFWHYHILDTMKYAKDCEQVFGYFLHHYPYVGLGDEVDPEDQVRAGQRMRELYQAEFGAMQGSATAGDGAAWCGAAIKTAWCGAAIKTAWCTAAIKTAWCTAPIKTAWCGAAIKTAWCGAAIKTAWCGAARPASAASNGATAWCTAPVSAETPRAAADQLRPQLVN